MPKETPLLKQYHAIKNQHRDAILFFRMGDFYEMFFDDAKVASKILDIALTSRNKEGEEKVPLCGVPYHAVDNYLAKLIKAGKKVAVCEQVEDPALAKGLVKREVIRVVTPGTVQENNLLEERQNNYLVALAFDIGEIGLSVVDMTTGEFKLTELLDDNKHTALRDELARLKPSECLIPRSRYEDYQFLDQLRAQLPLNLTPFDDWAFKGEAAREAIKKQFTISSLDSFGLADEAVTVLAAGALVAYLQETQKIRLKHLRPPRLYTTEDFMLLDEATIRNLELVSTIRGGERKGTLLDTLDQCVTAMGARLLYRSILQPLVDVARIKERHNAVAELKADSDQQTALVDILKQIADIERLVGRLGNDSANARDLLALRDSFEQVVELKKTLAGNKTPLLKRLTRDLNELPVVVDLVDQAIKDDASALLREGNLIKPGYDRDLDEIRTVALDSQQWIKNLEQQEIKRTGISKLKVRYNKIFGYYIEIPNGQVSKVPSDYIRKQTLVNAERYITPEMKAKEDLIINSEERLMLKEYEIFVTVRTKVAKSITEMQKTALSVAYIDLLNNFARLAVERRYNQPKIDDSDVLEITEGRHPVVEIIVPEGTFVPNDTVLNTKREQVAIITGPNMSGKSTYIRQVALLVLMAQVGSFIPVERARIGIVDRIFTRVGASDNLVRGQSTFMVEMQETANILNSATSRSLVILDEIGRGTSTFDGISIAWAVVEYVHSKQTLGAKALFATHYHELLELEKLLPRVKNYNVAVRESKDEVTFLYKIVPGGTNRSYGIYVGKLAGLPPTVVSRAQHVLSKLTAGEQLFEKEIGKSRVPEKQASLFAASAKESVMEKELQQVDIDKLTPIEALKVLDEMKKKLK